MKFNILKINKYFGHLGFLALLFLSIYFYQERVVFVDTIFQFFKIVNFEKFNIEAARYGTFITEIPLLIALKFGAGLKTLALIYSISFILVYYLVFLICTYLLKNVMAGIAILLSLVICISHSFYHPSTETHQAIVYAILLYAILCHDFLKWGKAVKYFLATVVLALSFYCHPVAIFIIIFIIGFYLVTNYKWKEFEAYYLIIFALVLAFVKLRLTNIDSYEGGFFSSLLSFNFGMSKLLKMYSFHFFTSRFLSLYVCICLLFAVTLVISIIKKEFLLSFYLLVSVFVFFVITLITYSNGDADVMMERSFMPLAVFTVLPFLRSVALLKNKKINILFCILIALIFFVSIIRISKQGVKYHARVLYTTELINETKKYNSQKFLLLKTEERRKAILYTWPFSFTTLVLSSFDGPENSRTIYLYDKQDDFLKYTIEKTNIFLGADFWLEWKSDILNHRYFNLPDGPYKFINIESEP